ncbi:hypothetical protein CBM2608_A160178 [Cupriavidus taiwanensis]|nr:hypothetical protein CBM2608_A160178 [Cupriavidus taiwanensis]
MFFVDQRFADDLYGGCSSVGRVQDCDSCRRGFESHQPPQNFLKTAPTSALFCCPELVNLLLGRRFAVADVIRSFSDGSEVGFYAYNRSLNGRRDAGYADVIGLHPRCPRCWLS